MVFPKPSHAAKRGRPDWANLISTDLPTKNSLFPLCGWWVWVWISLSLSLAVLTHPRPGLAASKHVTLHRNYIHTYMVRTHRIPYLHCTYMPTDTYNRDEKYGPHAPHLSSLFPPLLHSTMYLSMYIHIYMRIYGIHYRVI